MAEGHTRTLEICPGRLYRNTIHHTQDSDHRLLHPLSLLRTNPTTNTFRSNNQQHTQRIHKRPTLLFTQAQRPQPTHTHNQSRETTNHMQKNQSHHTTKRLRTKHQGLRVPHRRHINSFRCNRPYTRPHHPRPQPPQQDNQKSNTTNIQQLSNKLYNQLRKALFNNSINTRRLIPHRQRINKLQLFQLSLLKQHQPSCHNTKQAIRMHQSTTQAKNHSRKLLTMFSHQHTSQLNQGHQTRQGPRNFRNTHTTNNQGITPSKYSSNQRPQPSQGPQFTRR